MQRMHYEEAYADSVGRCEGRQDGVAYQESSKP